MLIVSLLDLTHPIEVGEDNTKEIAPAGTGRHGRPFVLAVDDDPRAIEIITSFFAGEAFEVQSAFGGGEAIEAATARRPDLLVVDLMMPEVSGFDVIEWMRGRPETAEVPIIVLTAKQLTLAEEEMLRKNVEHVFAKAATGRDEFLAEVRKVLVHGVNRQGSERGGS